MWQNSTCTRVDSHKKLDLSWNLNTDRRETVGLCNVAEPAHLCGEEEALCDSVQTSEAGSWELRTKRNGGTQTWQQWKQIWDDVWMSLSSDMLGEKKHFLILHQLCTLNCSCMLATWKKCFMLWWQYSLGQISKFSGNWDTLMTSLMSSAWGMLPEKPSSTTCYRHNE